MGLCTADTFNKYFTVAVLTAINLLNYMDRFTLAGALKRFGDIALLTFALSILPSSMISRVYGTNSCIVCTIDALGLSGV